METVVLRSDIARLVLGYLKNEKLDNVSRIFCKTSPHLFQEFTAYKRGLQAYSFLPDLEEIICEYVKITRKVEELLPSLNDSLRTAVQQGKLSDKVTKLLEQSFRTWLGQCTSGELATNDDKVQPSPTSSVHIVKNNRTKMRKDSYLKRKCRSVSSSSEDQNDQSINANRTKRRRILEPFCFLSAQLRDAQHATMRRNTPLHRDSESKVESSEDGNEDKITSDENNEQNKNALVDKPVNESTPCSKSESPHYLTPTAPELSQAILDNSEFQMKLVQNINEALHTSSNNCQHDERNDIGRIDIIQTRSVSAETSVAALVSEKTPDVSSSQLLDEMVKKIMEATEKDPSFDALIEEVVGEPASSKCFVSAGIQCNIGETTNEAVLVQQSADYRAESGIMVPQTPLIIRNAMAATTALTSDSHPMQTIAANTSFGSLIDPNFSISKLIVLNSNESAQKQLPAEQSGIGNTNADQFITQVASGIETSSSAIEDQVYFDAATGQLTFPLIFTNDGLLANMPFLINNEVVAQQLQLDNVTNLESSRIEIPLAESIVVSADQLPQNSIFLSSGQKAATDIQTLQQKQATQTSSKSVKDSLPSSIDSSRIQMERVTPSACSIVNTKAFKSLSTPRKRASHVRTLTFSPKSSAVPNQMIGGTPLSSRRHTLRMQGNCATSEDVKRTHVSQDPSSEKAIIKTVEVLPSLSAQVDPIASESSNSCNVPPLFAGEESSNQTVIRGKTPSTSEATTEAAKVGTITAPQDASVLSVPNIYEPSMNFLNNDVNTPKRKQQRRMAVRACKRQISNEEKKQDLEQVSGESESVTTNENQENYVGAECEVTDIAIEQNDEMMEEWLRMRNSSTYDLDSRLRELNAKTGHNKIPAKELKRNVRRKKVAASTVASAKRRKKLANISQHEKEKLELLNVSPSNQNVEKWYLQDEELKGKKRASKEKPKEFNVKITTPQKSKEKREELKNTSQKKDISKRVNEAEELNCANSSKIVEMPTAQASQHVLSKNDLEIEKRTANIACLLDTPVKEVNVSEIVPPTPGIFAPSLETPLSKLKPMDDVIQSASFLFGSLTKSELDTPMLSAITPGYRFTPLIGKDTTPRSVTGTEHSSGGSYYRPDESEDLDRNIDRLLRDSAQKKCVEKEKAVVESADSKQCEHNPQFQIVDCKSNAVSVEIRAEKLMVRPIVLKRVKSTDIDAVDNAGHDGVQIDPHYTLASGLPDLSDDEESSSSSSCSSKSTSKSSSSSQSSSKSTSMSNSVKSITVIVNKTSTASPLPLQSLYDISSSEDEEWPKLTDSKGESLQLVSTDGEVRYPVRSWLTPTKEKSTHQATTIKGTLPLKSSAEKRVQQVEVGDLELAGIKEKNMEIPEKVHEDLGVKVGDNATNILNMACEKDKIPLSSVLVAKSKVLDDEKRPIDVLTALNLSAKKRPRNEPQQRILGDIDDNAVSNLFIDCLTQERKELCVPHKAEQILRQTLQPKIGKSGQRKCLQIEALPLTNLLPPSKKINRAAARQTKIVRKPLGFKAAIEATAEGDGDVKTTMPGAKSRTSNVSPTPQIKKTRAPRVAGQRVSPRLCKGKASSSDATKEQKLVGSRALKTTLSATAKRTQHIQQLKASQKSKPAKNAIETLKPKNVQLSTKIQTHEGKIKHSKEQLANCESNIKNKLKKGVSQTSKKSQNLNIDTASGKDDMKIPDAPEFTTATNPISTSDEEDPFDGCELTSISENDPKYFHKFVYSGPEDWTPLPTVQPDFSNFKIVVAIDEHETYTWQMSDELTLFECAPVPKATSHTSVVTHNIRNIPKKRKVRITNTSNSEETTTVLPPTEVPPVLITTITPTDTNSQAAIISNTHTVISPAVEKLPLNAAEKIQIEDIESILSHLHGT